MVFDTLSYSAGPLPEQLLGQLPQCRVRDKFNHKEVQQEAQLLLYMVFGHTHETFEDHQLASGENWLFGVIGCRLNTKRRPQNCLDGEYLMSGTEQGRGVV